MFSLTALKNELINDPKAYGYTTYIANGDHNELAKLLNQQRSTCNKTVKITVAKLLQYAANNGIIAKIKDGSEGQDTPIGKTGKRSICLAALYLLQGNRSDIFDITDSTNVALLQGLVAIGILTTEQAGEIINLSGISPASRAEELFGDRFTVSHSQVAEALRS